MKKLLSILTLLVVAVTGAWADEDPTLSIGATEQTSATFLKDYETEGITISSTASWSSGAVQLGNTPSGETAYNSHYLQIAANASIAKVSFLMSGNGSNKKLQAPAFGWEETQHQIRQTHIICQMSRLQRLILMLPQNGLTMILAVMM